MSSQITPVLPAQGFPQITAPLTTVSGTQGRLTQVWYKFFVNLWQAVLAAQGNNTFNPGDVSLIAYPQVPIAWLLCDGAAYDRKAYENLFLAIGVAFGAGNGTTTFNVPNYVGLGPPGSRYIIHYGGLVPAGS